MASHAKHVKGRTCQDERVVSVNAPTRPDEAVPPPDEAPVPGRRERKKIETRAALEAAALRLFAERGYEQTTVDDIAEAADVAVRTFFRYFQSKQHVLFGDVALNIAARLRARPAAEPPVQAVGAALGAMDLEAEQQRQVLDRLRLLERLPELGGTYHMLLQQLHDVIAEEVAERTGTTAVDLDPQLLAAAATGSLRAALAVFEATGGERPLVELRDEAYARLTAGL
jgi:TetR/AcrR family transcriptional regulator, regulator of mycofactocin system